jgi:hypothetical protein
VTGIYLNHRTRINRQARAAGDGHISRHMNDSRPRRVRGNGAANFRDFPFAFGAQVGKGKSIGTIQFGLDQIMSRRKLGFVEMERKRVDGHQVPNFEWFDEKLSKFDALQGIALSATFRSLLLCHDESLCV